MNGDFLSLFDLLIIILKFAHHSVLMFIVYNVIYRQKVALNYSLLIKSGLCDKTKNLIIELIHT